MKVWVARRIETNSNGAERRVAELGRAPARRRAARAYVRGTRALQNVLYVNARVVKARSRGAQAAARGAVELAEKARVRAAATGNARAVVDPNLRSTNERRTINERTCGTILMNAITNERTTTIWAGRTTCMHL